MAKEPRTFIIINPNAGGGTARRHWPEVEAALQKSLGTFDSEETLGQGHARILAMDAAKEGYSFIIACGGDGTIHEVVNGIHDAKALSKTTLGLLSVGTGRDFIKTLGIPKDLKSQMEILSGQKNRTIDLGLVTYTGEKNKKERRVFVNIANAGIGHEVDRRVNQSSKPLGRKPAYFIAALQSYLAWKPKKIKVVPVGSDHHVAQWRSLNKKDKKCYSVIVANGRFFGGGMPIAPQADPSDGLLDLVVVTDVNPLIGFLGLGLVYSKYFGLLPNVFRDRVRKVTFQSEEKVSLDIDGEDIGSLPATFEILPEALRVKCP